MKKVIVIGGGIAGLSAGIFAQTNGFETEIYEKHTILGGECTGWNRNGYHIDNCIHWMTGTKKGTSLYDLWEYVGAFGKDVEIIQRDSFFTCEYDGKTLTLWKDIDRTEREMLELAPEDEKQIKEFAQSVRAAEAMEMPTDKPMDMYTLHEMIKLGKSMGSAGKIYSELGKISVKEYAEKFSSQIIRHTITDFMFDSYPAYAMIFSYATFTSGNGSIPKGTSLGVVQRMQKRFEEAGGKVHTGIGAAKINIDGKTANSVTFSDGSTAEADYIICACDANVTFGQLLDKKYMPKNLLWDMKIQRITF